MGYRILVLAFLFCGGCGTAVFEPNGPFAKRLEQENDIELSGSRILVDQTLTELFGTPDEPRWPKVIASDAKYASLVDLERLTRAAGPVRSDREDRHFGLYREHCSNCHGLTGNGAGPSALFLSPYPRDFRMGVFKYKSTPRTQKPTPSDLNGLLVRGIPGTSMPSFASVEQADRVALIDYVRYLSVRGELERRLLYRIATDFDGDSAKWLEGSSVSELNSQVAIEDRPESARGWLNKSLREIADTWINADSLVTAVPTVPEQTPIYPDGASETGEKHDQLIASIARGRALFGGVVANCSKCHGPLAMGDGEVTDFDDWTKDWTIRAGIDPSDRAAVKPFLAVGALKPVSISPRNLRIGMLRGSPRPDDLYRRLVNGIDGTPMPELAMQPNNPAGLQSQDVWDLVNYVQSLPDDPLSKAAFSAVSNKVGQE